MLGTIDIMLVAENTIVVETLVCVITPFLMSYIPYAHARSRYTGKLDCSRETLVTLRIIVLEPNLQFDGLEEVSLLLVGREFEQRLHIRAHSGCRAGESAQIVIARNYIAHRLRFWT